jgi:glyoxylase-like metal-dependent hydrolase (beta-lactamase superfamily II)
MVRIDTFPLGPLQTNAYLVVNELTQQAVIIDPGMNPKALLRKIEQLEIVAILLTHAHFDHIGGLEAVRTAKQCPVYLHPLEAEWLTDAKLNGSLRWPDVTPPIVAEPAEYDLADGQKLSFLGMEWTVLHTPGHSPGSVSFLLQQHLFGGDVLFKLGVGRSDLPGGNSRTLFDSISRKLFSLSGDTIVYPGHGPKTTIAYEQEHNPYV